MRHYNCNRLYLLLAAILATGISCTTGKPKVKRTIKSVLVIGNSIVLHGPAPQIGWNGNWGMAATVADSDFVHLLARAIHDRDSTVSVKPGLAVGFEGGYDKFSFSKFDTFKTPDMLIIRLSENVDDEKAKNGGFIKYYDSMLHYIDPQDKAVKVIVSGVWKRPVFNEQLEDYARKHDYVFVKNDDLLADSSNFAWGRFANEGVAAHPSDKGMRLIKERIWAQIKDYF